VQGSMTLFRSKPRMQNWRSRIYVDLPPDGGLPSRRYGSWAWDE